MLRSLMFNHSPLPTLRLAAKTLAISALLAVSSGCSDEHHDDAPDSGGESGIDMCNSRCDSTERNFACCVPGSDDCVAECLESDSSDDCPSPYSSPGGRITCDNAVAETNGSWAPSSFISQTPSGEYEIDQSNWDNLLANPGQLLHDNARVDPFHDGSYEFTGIQAGDFFDELGFQNGDIIKTINGRSILTDADAWSAFNDFYSSTTFRVTVSRSGSDVSMTYVIQ